MFKWARPLTKLLMKDYYLDRRSAAKFSKILKNIDELSEIEEEIKSNLSGGGIKKIDSLMNKHKTLVSEIMEVFKFINSNENLSFENDVKEPKDAIVGFLKVLEEHSSDLKDPTLNKKVKTCLNNLNSNYLKFETHLEQEIAAVTETYAREVMGVTSQYALATGGIHDLAEIIGASESKKQEIDKHVEKIIKEIKSIKGHIIKYLENKKEKTSIDLNRVFKNKAVVGVWYKIGEKEFRQRLYKYKTKKGGYQIHRWVVRKAGTKNAGVFANKVDLATSGIFHHELLVLLNSFEKNFSDLIKNVWDRAQVTKHNLANIGFISYKIKSNAKRIESELLAAKFFEGETDAVARLVLSEREEEKEVKSALSEFVSYGTRSLAFAKASIKNILII